MWKTATHASFLVLTLCLSACFSACFSEPRQPCPPRESAATHPALTNDPTTSDRAATGDEAAPNPKAAVPKADHHPAAPRLVASTDAQRALGLAEALLAAEGRPLDTLKLILAKNLVVKGDGTVAPHLWRLTFKPARLLPMGPSDPIGAGGEIFVEVDLTAGRARITGYGE